MGDGKGGDPPAGEGSGGGGGRGGGWGESKAVVTLFEEGY